MSDNVQKYENWRAITESDYVTMFIKTWFAFVATLRELYPKENLDEVIGKGDKAFLSPYLNDFQNRYYHYNKLVNVKENILKVYKLGRRFTLENPKYHRFFAEDFYTINKLYSWKQKTDDYELSIKYSGDTELSIHVKYLDKDLYIDGIPLIVAVKIDVSDLVSSKNLSDTQIARFIDDESAFIDFVAKGIIDRASLGFIERITNGDYKSKFSSKVLAKLNSTTLTINASIVQELALMKEPNIKKQDVLFSQLPCVHFIYDVEDGKPVPEIDTYTWFLNFVYFMRNALFHEIIDPLDEFWQDMFKCAYLALKEVLDANIRFFIDRAAVISSIVDDVMSCISDNEEDFLPGLIDGSDVDEPDVQIIKYLVSEDGIEIEFAVLIDYWASMYTVNQTKIVGKAKFIGEGKNIEIKDINFSIDSINKVKEI